MRGEPQGRQKKDFSERRVFGEKRELDGSSALDGPIGTLSSLGAE
jgi:hypothetical protein